MTSPAVGRGPAWRAFPVSCPTSRAPWLATTPPDPTEGQAAQPHTHPLNLGTSRGRSLSPLAQHVGGACPTLRRHAWTGCRCLRRGGATRPPGAAA